MAKMKIRLKQPFVLLALAICILCEMEDLSDLRFQNASISPLRKVVTDFSHLTRVTNAISLQNLAIGRVVKMRDVGAELLGTRRGEFGALLDVDVATIKSVVEKIPDPSNVTRSTTNITAEQQAALEFVASKLKDVQILTTAKSLKIADIFSKIKGQQTNVIWQFCDVSFSVVNPFKVLNQTSTLNVIDQKNVLQTFIGILSADVLKCFTQASQFITKRKNDSDIFQSIDQLAEVTELLESYKRHFAAVKTLSTLLGSLKNDLNRTSNLNQLTSNQHASDLEMANNARVSHSFDKVRQYTAGFPRGYLDLSEVLNDVRSGWFLKNVANGNKENVRIVEQGLERFKVFSDEMMKLEKSWKNFSNYSGSIVPNFTGKWKKIENSNMDSAVGVMLKKYESDFKDCLSRGNTSLPNTVLSDIQAVIPKFALFKNTVNNLTAHLKTANSTVNVQLLDDFFKNLKQYTLVTELQENINNIKALPNFEAFQTAGAFMEVQQKFVADITQIAAPTTMPDLQKIMNETNIHVIHSCFSNKSLDGQNVLNAIEFLKVAETFSLTALEKAEVKKYLDALEKTQKDGLAFETAVYSAYKGRTRRMTDTSGTTRDFKVDLPISQILGSGLQTLHHMDVALGKKPLLQGVMDFNKTVSSVIVSVSTPTAGGKRSEDAEVAAAFENPRKTFGKVIDELEELNLFASTANDDLTSLGKIFEKASTIRGFAGEKEALEGVVIDLQGQSFDNEATTVEELSNLELNFAKGSLESMDTTLAAAKAFFDGLFSSVHTNPEAQRSSGPDFVRESMPSFPIWKLFAVIFGNTVLALIIIGYIWVYLNWEEYKDLKKQVKAENEEMDEDERLYETQDMVEFENRWRFSIFLDRWGGHNLCFEYTRMTHEQYVEFIEDGAFINCYNVYGNTPLHLATKAGIPEWVELLIRNGADRTLLNPKNKTPEEVIPKNLQEMKEPEKFKKIEEIYKSLKDQKFPLRVPRKFETSMFKIYIDPRVDPYVVERFKKRHPTLISEKLDHDTTHMVVNTEEVTRWVNINSRDIDYPVLLAIFKGVILLKDDFVSACLIAPKTIDHSYKFFIEFLVLNGTMHAKAVPSWTAAQSKGSMPYLYGAHVIFTATTLTNSYLHEIVEHLGGVVLPSTPDHYMYNETARPYLLSHLGALFIIHNGEIDEKRLKPHPLLTLFTPDEFIAFLLKREIRRNESKPVIPLMGPTEP